MKKIILFSIISIFLSGISFAGFCSSTSSTKPPICTNSPDWLENYLENAVSMINNINTNKKVTGPKGLGMQAWQTPVGAVRISIFFYASGLGNFFQNFFIIFEDQHIVRDWVKLIDFKQYITRYFLKASGNGILTEDIDNLEKIKNKIKQGKYFLLTGDIKTYQDTLKYILVNQLIIEKIYYDEIVNGGVGNIENFKENKTIQDIIKSLKENTQFSIDENKLKEYIIKLRETYYENGKKIECSSAWTNFIKAIHNIVCNTGANKVHKAMQRFSCNYERLKYALNLGGSIGNCGSVKLKDWVSLKDRIKVKGLGKVKQDLKEIGKIIPYKILSKILSKIYEGLIDLFKKKQMLTIRDLFQKIQMLTNRIYKRKHNIENLKLEELKTNLNKINTVIISDKKSVNNMIIKVEASEFTHNTTIMFPKISHEIYKIRNLLEIDDNSIYENTAKACENQSPFGGKCRPSGN